MKGKQQDRASLYITLQEKHPGKLVAYDKNTYEIYAVGKTLREVNNKVEKKNVIMEDVVFAGPIPKPGHIYVYPISVFEKTYK